MQQKEFTKEYIYLTLVKELSTGSKILPLNPRIDENGLTRSGGRLENVDYLSFDVKYPIILPRTNWITKLIVNYYHEERSSLGRTKSNFGKIQDPER